jgi:hypothetical protein
VIVAAGRASQRLRAVLQERSLRQMFEVAAARRQRRRQIRELRAFVAVLSVPVIVFVAHALLS